MIRQGTPFRPDYAAQAREAASAVTRTLTRALIAQARGGPSSAAMVRTLYPNDHQTIALVDKGAVVPTSGVLGRTVLADLVSIVGPTSAFANIVGAALPVSLDRNSGVLVPTVVSSGSGVAFLASASPMPVVNYAFSGPTITNKKVGAAFAVTRQLTEASNAETIIKALLRENVTLGLETILLDDVAADTVRPAGLRQGVAATAPEAGGGVEAMKADISNITSTVALKAGDLSNVIVIASPDRVVKILMSVPNFPFRLFASSAIDGVIAIAANALAVAGGDEIRFSASDETTIHMEDTTPLPISSVGTPNTVAAPVKNMWQMDCTAFRLVADVNWALRTTGAVAWVDGSAVTW